MRYLMQVWGTSPIPPGLLEMHHRARRVKGSTPERAVWCALRMYLLSKGQPMNLHRDELPALVARAKQA